MRQRTEREKVEKKTDVLFRGTWKKGMGHFVENLKVHGSLATKEQASVRHRWPSRSVGGRKEDKENTEGSGRKEQGFLQNLGRMDEEIKAGCVIDLWSSLAL